MKRDYTLIAEVKPASPFGWRSERSWDELFALAAEHGDWVSVHTDPRWEGSFELVRTARQRTTKPILAKGIHADDADIERALDAGADWVLVVGRVPAQHIDRCLLEPRTIKEISAYPPEARVVWNARNLRDGSRKTETFVMARHAWPHWLCQASHILTDSDVEPEADAVLVGENLPKFIASLKL